MLNLSTLKTPGVYIDEVSLLPPSVAGVETGIPAFVGYTEKNVTSDGVALLNKPTRITSMLDYSLYFGGAQPENDGITVTIKDVIDKIDADPTKEKLVSREIHAALDPAKKSKFNLYYSLLWYFANGGGPCYIVSVGLTPADGTGAPVKLALIDGVKTLESEDEPTMIVVPEAIASGDDIEIYEAALLQAARMGDRMVIVDVVQTATSKLGVAADMTTFRDNLDQHRMFAAAYYPYIDTSIDIRYADTALKIAHTRKDLVGGSGTGSFDNLAFSAVTNKEIQELIRKQISKMPLTMPPSPAMAAVWASTDRDRGVWKAPANVGLANVIGPNIKIDDDTQNNMNVDATSGKSVNAIRLLMGRGTVVWGARTLMGESNEWRYINIRRFFNFVEESVKKATYRFVFEPNDANTWVKVRGMAENFLTLQWRAGALMGAKPEHAFFVRVGLGQTMTKEDVDNGFLIIEIGMAAVRPAEFIVLRFMHKPAES